MPFLSFSKPPFVCLLMLGFWLWEPVFKDGGRVLLTVRDCFGSGSQFLKDIVINCPEPFSLRESVFRGV